MEKKQQPEVSAAASGMEKKIERIVDARMVRKPKTKDGSGSVDDFQYKVKWEGLSESENTWVSENEIGDYVAVEKFWGAKMNTAPQQKALTKDSSMEAFK